MEINAQEALKNLENAVQEKRSMREIAMLWLNLREASEMKNAQEYLDEMARL